MLEKEMMQVLDTCYEKGLKGLKIPGERTVVELAEDYLRNNDTKEEAINNLIKNQTILCGTNGFVTGVGGLLALPVTVPVNVASVIYIQLRMIAAIAYIKGYDIYSDQVKTMAYLCLTGSSAASILKNLGVKIGEKVAMNVLKKIPGTVLSKINQKVGFKLVTKFGEKGVVNLVKMMPLVGGVVGGIFDTGTTLTIGNLAKEVFTEVISQEDFKDVEYAL